mmetsp:Transcript_42320/g.132626  ORF Transcript_42320/g.132626 Transcript_42320/m.132626 type:complete len:234 (+) Transcript_42320:275-976(+)
MLESLAWQREATKIQTQPRLCNPNAKPKANLLFLVGAVEIAEGPVAASRVPVGAGPGVLRRGARRLVFAVAKDGRAHERFHLREQRRRHPLRRRFLCGRVSGICGRGHLALVEPRLCDSRERRDFPACGGAARCAVIAAALQLRRALLREMGFGRGRARVRIGTMGRVGSRLAGLMGWPYEDEAPFHSLQRELSLDPCTVVFIVTICGELSPRRVALFQELLAHDAGLLKLRR